MALLTPVGGRESNSFCTLAEAEASLLLYVSEDGTTLPADWDALKEPQKEYRLLLAVAALAYFPWRGKRVYCGQALPFPRDFQEDHTIVPQDIKDAQALIVYHAIHQAMKGRPDEEGTENPLEGADLRVTQVSLGGMLAVALSGDPAKAGTIIEWLVKTALFPIYLQLAKYTSQVRGGVIEDRPRRHRNDMFRGYIGYYDFWGYSSQGVYRGPPHWEHCLTTTTSTSTSTTSTTGAPTTTTTSTATTTT